MFLDNRAHLEQVTLGEDGERVLLCHVLWCKAFGLVRDSRQSYHEDKA